MHNGINYIEQYISIPGQVHALISTSNFFEILVISSVCLVIPSPMIHVIWFSPWKQLIFFEKSIFFCLINLQFVEAELFESCWNNAFHFPSDLFKWFYEHLIFC